MSSTLRIALLSSALSLTVGCGFFSLDDAEDPVKPKPKMSTGGAGTSTSAGMGGTVASTGGSGGTGGDAGSATMGGAGGSSAGAGGTTAGTGNMTAGTGGGMMAGSGGSGAGSPPMGGSGGDVALGGMGGTMAGGPAGGVSGSAGSGPTTCATLNPGSQAFGGHCYLLVTSAATFGTAKSSCMAMNAHLVTISNGDPAAQATFDAEDQFVYTLAGGKDAWLGLTDGKMDTDAPDGTFYGWINQEASPPAEWGTAYGWVDGEPNNYKKGCASGNGDCYEHCGMMVADQGGKWNDDLCESMKQYICEWDMGG